VAFAVPNVAGVPPLLGGFAPTPALPALNDISNSLPSSLSPSWGIFLNGAAVVTADSVISMDARQEAVVADFPLEGGTFESYDKVDRPFDVRFRFASGGNDANRAALFSSVKALLADKTNQYMFISPEDAFESINGVGLPAVDVWGWQLLVGQSSTSANDSQSVGAAPQSNTGVVQPVMTASNYDAIVSQGPVLTGGPDYAAVYGTGVYPAFPPTSSFYTPP
jgi:hypothetical protein